jgi:phosphoglucomutase
MGYLESYKLWCKKTTGEIKEELLKIESDDDAIKSRFILPLGFGTAGMRGVLGVGEGRMNIYTVRRATKGLASLIAEEGAQKKGVVIAYDTRRMSFEFALEAAKVLAGSKIRVYLFEDVRPVPMCSFAVRHLETAAGIMITASHNPKQYNGYKVYGADGAQMGIENTQKVVAAIQKTDYFDINIEELEIFEREAIRGKDKFWLNDYVSVIGKSVDEKYYEAIEQLCLSPAEIKTAGKSLKIVYTPIHGAGKVPVTSILKKLQIPFETVAAQEVADPDFSTVSVPNPENAEALTMGIALAKNVGADIVLGTDPDCDRMGVAVKNKAGEFAVLTGNQIGALIMDYILLRRKALGTLPQNAAVVKTIVTSGLADKIAKSYGAEVFSVLTGFKFIGEKIKEWEENNKHTFIFGYEESFGYLAGTHARDKDAVVAAMLFAEAACYFKTKDVTIFERLEELYKTHGFYAEGSKSFEFTGLFAMQEMSDIMQKLRKTAITEIGGIEVVKTSDYANGVDGLPKTDAVKYFLQDGSWLAVRPSGTEPKLKLYVSAVGKTAQAAAELNMKLTAELGSKLGLGAE